MNNFFMKHLKNYEKFVKAPSMLNFAASFAHFQKDFSKLEIKYFKKDNLTANEKKTNENIKRVIELVEDNIVVITKYIDAYDNNVKYHKNEKQIESLLLETNSLWEYS